VSGPPHLTRTRQATYPHSRSSVRRGARPRLCCVTPCAAAVRPQPLGPAPPRFLSPLVCHRREILVGGSQCHTYALLPSPHRTTNQATHQSGERRMEEWHDHGRAGSSPPASTHLPSLAIAEACRRRDWSRSRPSRHVVEAATLGVLLPLPSLLRSPLICSLLSLSWSSSASCTRRASGPARGGPHCRAPHPPRHLIPLRPGQL
jgi:hypothetical protein